MDQGFPPLFHYKAGEVSSTTPSAHSPYNEQTKWGGCDPPPLLNVKNRCWSNLDKPSQSWAAWVTAKHANPEMHGPGERFGPESDLTFLMTRRLEDTLHAIGARNFRLTKETTTRSRRGTTLKIDAWGSIDLTIFTDTGNLASAEEDKLPSALSGKHPYNNNKTATQVYNYLSWMAINLGVKHPFCLLVTGDKAALCYRDVDKEYAEEVIGMDFEERKKKWPERLLQHPASTTTSGEATTPRHHRLSSKTESPEPRTPIAKTEGKPCLPCYSRQRGCTNKGGGGHKRGVMKEGLVHDDDEAAPSGGRNSPMRLDKAGGGQTTAEVGQQEDSAGSSSGSKGGGGAPGPQSLYRSAIYQVCDLKGYKEEEIAKADAKAACVSNQLLDPRDGGQRWINYAALVSAALATGTKLQPQPLYFNGRKESIPVANYKRDCEHAVFTLKKWTLRFGRPNAKFKVYAVLRQLGIGSDGVVHLVAGAANDGAVVDVCVAKRYHDSAKAESQATKELNRAAAVSTGVLDASYFSVRKIGNHVAFFMPYFEPVPFDKRLEILESEEFNDLLERIAKAGLRPCFKDNEVHWRHIGMFLDMDKKRHVTMIDLLRFEELEVPRDNVAKGRWLIEVGMWQQKVRNILRARATNSTRGMADEDILAIVDSDTANSGEREGTDS